MAQSSRTAVVAAFLVAVVVVAAASVPAASAFGCYDDCYQRCANGKEDPVCKGMCTQACGADAVDLSGGAAATAGAAAAGTAAAGAGAAKPEPPKA